MKAQMRESGDHLAGHYSSTAATYRALWAPVLESLSLPLLDELPLSNTGRILDAGTGVGTLLPHLRTAASHALIVGIDRSPGMIALAPKAFPLAVADIAELPLSQGAVDVAVLAFMLFPSPRFKGQSGL